MSSDLVQKSSGVTLTDNQEGSKGDLEEFADSITTEIQSMAQNLDGSTVDPEYEALMQRFGAREHELHSAHWARNTQQEGEIREAILHSSALRILKAYQTGRVSGARAESKNNLRETLKKHDHVFMNPSRYTISRPSTIMNFCAPGRITMK
jgi:hypothetical protein